MNNSDFQRLLTTNDRELVTELTKRKKGGSAKAGKGQGKGKDDKAIARIAKANRYKQKALDKAEKDAEKNKYRDRAAERRDAKGEYEKVAAEFENHGEVPVDQSKYLGGDLEHTHLVKGLDFALLNKVRTEIAKKQKADEFQKAKQERKITGGKQKKTFEHMVAKNVWLTVVETLHPHHSTFKERVQKMGKAIAQGHRIRNAPSVFLPGRMAFEFDTDLEMGKTDIPRIVYMSKEEVPVSEMGKRSSGMLPETAVRVRNAMQKAAEDKKQRKLQKNLGAGASYTTAQKIEVSKVKARDGDNDIFAGAGAFDVNEIVRKARAEQAAKRDNADVKQEKEVSLENEKPKKSSYFDDAGDEKYRKAPDRQLDLEEIEVEESTLEPGEFHKPTGRFEASRKFRGARKNWVFKLGDEGLGYYEEIPPKKAAKPADPAKQQEKDPRKRKPAAASSGAQGMGNPGNEAYDELFPSSMMGGAMMTTHSDDSDDDDGKKKKQKGKDGKKGTAEDSVAANKKGAEAKKRKMNENQQWQKIDNMIKKGKVTSMESMEAQAFHGHGRQKIAFHEWQVPWSRISVLLHYMVFESFMSCCRSGGVGVPAPFALQAPNGFKKAQQLLTFHTSDPRTVMAAMAFVMAKSSASTPGSAMLSASTKASAQPPPQGKAPVQVPPKAQLAAQPPGVRIKASRGCKICLYIIPLKDGEVRVETPDEMNFVIPRLDAAIEADPFDLNSWDARLREAIQEGKAEPVFERAVTQLPYAARIWAAYAEWSEMQDSAAALGVYSRCLQQVPNLDLWLSFLNFSKRHQTLEEVLRSYGRALDVLGSDWRAAPVWSDYLALLKHAYNVQQKKENPDAELQGKLLAEDPNPIDSARRTLKPALKQKQEEAGRASADISDAEFLRVSEILKIDTDFLRCVFQRCAGASHSTMDKLWVGYEQFEKSQGNPALAAKLMSEHMPRYVRGKAAYKELSQLAANIDHYAVAVPLTPQNVADQSKLFEKWRAVLRFERTNPLQLGTEELTARVALVYQQASLACGFFPDLWFDFSAWLDLGGKQEEATDVLRKAVERFLPKDLTLRLLLAQRFELGESPLAASKLEAADDEYKKLMEDMPKPCPLALINYLAYVRRQRGANDFRDTFLEVTEASPHCSWEVYVFAAMTEYHVYGSIEAAAAVFRLGLDRYGDREPALLAAYVNFLLGCNDLRSARAELSQGVLERLQQAVRDRLANREESLGLRESLAFLWQKWARLECYFGDAEAVRRATSFRDSEYRNLQRDLEVDAENILQTPISLGLSTSIQEVEEGFRFLHLIPRSTRPQLAAYAEVVETVQLEDQSVADAEGDHRRLGNATPAIGLSSHIARPDTSKMLTFRPALDIASVRKRQLEAGQEREDKAQLPVMIPKCLQDLLAVLPSRPLKGAKPDVDYLLTVLQTVSIPPVSVKELDTFRYDSLRLLKTEEDTRRIVKDEDDGNGFFSSRSTIYRERLQAKRTLARKSWSSNTRSQIPEMCPKSADPHIRVMLRNKCQVSFEERVLHASIEVAPDSGEAVATIAGDTTCTSDCAVQLLGVDIQAKRVLNCTKFGGILHYRRNALETTTSLLWPLDLHTTTAACRKYACERLREISELVQNANLNHAACDVRFVGCPELQDQLSEQDGQSTSMEESSAVESVSSAQVEMGDLRVTPRSIKHVLPFLDGVELAAAEAVSKAAKDFVLRRQLWEGLCQAYISEVLQNQDGKTVPWPERQKDSDGKQYFTEVFDIAHMVRNGEVNQCETCGTWYSSEDSSGLDCEGCNGHWCDDCAERGPSHLRCPECPDFSKTHCWQCFADGKVERCECCAADADRGMTAKVEAAAKTTSKAKTTQVLEHGGPQWRQRNGTGSLL
ncbi:CSTF77 [Symbiodinium sp. KB8]|nr:CSTF77 [Symbiodinium sp. KB8]